MRNDLVASIGVAAVVYVLIQIGVVGYVYRQAQLNETLSPLATAGVVLLLSLITPFILDGVLLILVIEAALLGVYLFFKQDKSKTKQTPGSK